MNAAGGNPAALERRAVIDIGSNSVKALIADVGPGRCDPVEEMGTQTRLAEGLHESGRLASAPIERTVEVCGQWMDVIRKAGARRFRVVATSAAREATNVDALLHRISERLPGRTQIIDGDLEARWAFMGVVDRRSARPTLVIDVGGGSVEFAWGLGADLKLWHSLPIGVVRLLEAAPVSNPPTVEERAETGRRIKERLDRALPAALEAALADAGDLDCVAVGGSSAILANVHFQWPTFERDRIDAAVLSRSTLVALGDRLWSAPLKARQEFIGLPPERADVILMAVSLFETILDRWEIGALRPSTRGLRFGAVADPVGPWFPVG